MIEAYFFVAFPAYSLYVTCVPGQAGGPSWDLDS
jgi:hypothetical protein